VKGKCLCGSVSAEVEEAPEYINICNCRFCRSLGAAWGYYETPQVRIDGKTVPYRRDDLYEIWLEGHFCPTCGTTTHYTVIKAPHQDRMAINTRLFEQNELDGIEVRYLDIRGEDQLRTGKGHIGDGKAF